MKTGLTLEMNVRQILLTFTTEKFEVLLIPHSLLSFIYKLHMHGFISSNIRKWKNTLFMHGSSIQSEENIEIYISCVVGKNMKLFICTNEHAVFFRCPRICCFCFLNLFSDVQEYAASPTLAVPINQVQVSEPSFHLVPRS